MTAGISYRQGTAEDEHYILNTWLEQLRHEYPDMRTDDYFSWMRGRITERAQHGVAVIIAHPESEPRVIWGFCVYSDGGVHYLYVRPQHQRVGIGRELWTRATENLEKPYVVTAVTDTLRAYKRKHPDAVRYIPL